MRDAENSLSLTTTVSVLAAAAAVSFQLAYFVEIGREFITLASPLDFLFPIVVIMPFPLMLAYAVILLISYVERKVLSGDWDRTYLGYAFNILGRHPIKIVGGFMLASLLGAHLLSSVIFTTITCLGVIALMAFAKMQFCERKAIEVETIIYLALGLASLSSSLGGAYARQAGRECSFNTTDGHIWRGKYLRGLAEGHLVRKGDATVYISKSTIKEISCEKAWHLPGPPLAPGESQV